MTAVVALSDIAGDVAVVRVVVDAEQEGKTRPPR